MLAGIEKAQAQFTIRVTPEMTARLAEEEIHPVYSTFWLGRHVELAARKVIEPYFENGEDAVGAALSIQHKAMTPVGAEVVIKAWVSKIHGALIHCNFEVFHGTLLVADGSQDQFCMSAGSIRQKIADAYKRL